MAAKGSPLSPETRAKIAAALTGHVHTDASRAKMSAAKGGPRTPEEQRADANAYMRAYYARRKAGAPIRLKPPAGRTGALPDPARFWARVDKSGDCWLWTGPQSNGYGCGRFPGSPQNQWAHRIAYELERGPIPDGMELDHLCRNRLCCNPAHLDVVTHAENRHRGLLAACRRGHPFTPENTYVSPTGVRVCRACNNARQRAFQAKRRAG